MPDINLMTPLTTEQLLADFDGILDRVETGECFVIDIGAANAVVLIPYEMYQAESASSSTSTADAPLP